MPSRQSKVTANASANAPAASGALSRRPRQTLVVGLWLALTALICVGFYQWRYARILNDQVSHAHRQLTADASALKGALEKNESLPFVMALQPVVPAALSRPDDAAATGALNAYLSEVALRARLAAAYVVDANGQTIASSNWNLPSSFVGHNYRFRPYVQAALAGDTGRFYGVGATTADPGYFLARPVFAGATSQASAAKPIGAIAIKIKLEELERSWSSTDDPVALTDANNVVFLSNQASWKYRSLGPLSKAARDRLTASQQYAGRSVQRLESEPSKQSATRIELPVAPLDWHLIRFASTELARRGALVAVGACAALSAFFALLFYARHQREQRIRVAQRAREQLLEASSRLEEQIVVRTQELLHANVDLGNRCAELKHTEHMLRATQNELVQAGKLGMLGQMAAGVTHELSQPLTALRAFADNAAAFLERGDAAAAHENLAHIGEACERMRCIIGQLKGFLRKSPETLGPVNLATSIDMALLLLRGDIQLSGATLEVDVDPCATVLADSVRLEQVIVNLLRNALDAVQGIEPARIAINARVDRQVRVRVIDNGPGITREAQAHLFEPFFTTKSAGRGLGLGLAISSSIVQAMQGELVAHNVAGGGAEFVLTLPLLETEKQAA